MPREPRGPLPERACSQCKRTYRPVTGPKGGQPPARCDSCRRTVRELRPARPAKEPTDDLDLLIQQTTAQSRIADEDVRRRLLDISNLLDSENSTLDSHTIDVCARTLRELCGYGAKQARKGQAG